MRRFGYVAAGLLLAVSVTGCCYRPGYYDPVTGMAWGGYWEPCCPAPWPHCWGYGCGPAGAGFGPGPVSPYYGGTPTYGGPQMGPSIQTAPQPVVPQEGYYVDPGYEGNWVPAEPMEETPAPPSDGADPPQLPPEESSYYTPTGRMPRQSASASPRNDAPIVTPAYGPGDVRASRPVPPQTGQRRWIPAGY